MITVAVVKDVCAADLRDGVVFGIVKTSSNCVGKEISDVADFFEAIGSEKAFGSEVGEKNAIVDKYVY